MTDYDKQLAHLVEMATQPAWKEYAWHRAKELERCETGMWLGIAQDLVSAMKAKKG